MLLLAGAGPASVTPLAARAKAFILAAGGAFYDPSDLTSLFQDAAGTTPVTASGQPVRLMRDVSGNGFHAVAPSDAARPVLTSEVVGSVTRWYLAVDGVDDFMVATPTLNLTSSWWAVGGWRPSATGNRYMFALSDLGTKAASKINATSLGWRNAADTAFTNLISGVAVDVAFVSTHEQASTALIAGRLNGVDAASFAPFDVSASARGLALFSDKNLTSSQPYAGRFYGGAFAPGAASVAARSIVESYVTRLTLG